MTKETISEKQAHAMAQVCLDLHDALGCKWGDNPYLAIDRLKTAAQSAPVQPVGTYGEIFSAMWLLLRSGTQRDQQIYEEMKDKPLYTTPPAAQPAVPDAIHHTDLSETLEYINGWNDCRAETNRRANASWSLMCEKMVAAEREACAKVCDAVAQQMDDEGEGPTGNIGWVIGCADAIRARGNI